MHLKLSWRLKNRLLPDLYRILPIVFACVLTACNIKLTRTEIEPSPTNVQVEINATATITTINASVSDDQAARLALTEFFDYLHTGRYEEAMVLYGGTYQTMIDQNPAIDPQDQIALLRNACTINGFQCLQIKIAGIDRKPSTTEFVFVVQFQNSAGSVFALTSETEQTPRSFFEIRVTKTPQGEFHVIDMPPYMP